TSAGGPARDHSKTCYTSSLILGLGVSPMRRREFIALLGSSVIAWPLAASAQQGERMRRIGVLLPAAANDPEFQARIRAFQQELEQSGWSIGRNIQLDMRWATPDAAKIRQQAAELVALAPDGIFTIGVRTMPRCGHACVT